MTTNKHIQRDTTGSSRIFNERSLSADYRTLIPLLKPGMAVLDVGCGTGSISRDIARMVGPGGHVTGIDNTEGFITTGREAFGDVANLQLFHADLFSFRPDRQFDLVIAARVLQWLANPVEALQRMRGMLAPGGCVSILDYNHEALQWTPDPPESMRYFYQTFLRWRADAGMNNHIGDDLPAFFRRAGFVSVAAYNADEFYDRDHPAFASKLGIWSQVASSRQMVDEGYLTEEQRIKAVQEYDAWVATKAESMVMKLAEVRGYQPE